ncbi:unnamed protein product [Closterium sp. Naga37s-1]|nr:unnamed protein product [Closterium sp. Naga37s-1]
MEAPCELTVTVSGQEGVTVTRPPFACIPFGSALEQQCRRMEAVGLRIDNIDLTCLDAEPAPHSPQSAGGSRSAVSATADANGADGAPEAGKTPRESWPGLAYQGGNGPPSPCAPVLLPGPSFRSPHSSSHSSPYSSLSILPPSSSDSYDHTLPSRSAIPSQTSYSPTSSTLHSFASPACTSPACASPISVSPTSATHAPPFAPTRPRPARQPAPGFHRRSSSLSVLTEYLPGVAPAACNSPCGATSACAHPTASTFVSRPSAEKPPTPRKAPVAPRETGYRSMSSDNVLEEWSDIEADAEWVAVGGKQANAREAGGLDGGSPNLSGYRGMRGGGAAAHEDVRGGSMRGQEEGVKSKRSVLKKMLWRFKSGPGGHAEESAKGKTPPQQEQEEEEEAEEERQGEQEQERHGGYTVRVFAEAEC